MKAQGVAFVGCFILLTAAVMVLQWAAIRYLGHWAIAALTLAVIGGLLWIAQAAIPDAIQAARAAGTCFNCDLAYYYVPILWGYSVWFAVAAIAIVVRHSQRRA